MRSALPLICILLALPVLGVLAAWFGIDANALAVLEHQASTVLTGYAVQSLLLALGVGLGVLAMGCGAAIMVSLFEFPGRRVFEWALLLPLAMPAYVLAYAWTDALQFSGPLQQALRAATGWQGALWPDVRSLWGATALFVFCLYPYVYILARGALGDRAVPMLEAARMLGAGGRRRLFEVALPLARPALAAGVGLALMETLADYGVGSYFGLSTFSTGIYKAWIVMNDRVAAAQLASLLLLVVAVLLWFERRAQKRLRFGSKPGSASAADARLHPLHGRAAALAVGLCAFPVLMGFVLPVAWLSWLLGREAMLSEFGLPMARFAQWAWASFRLASAAAFLALGLALLLAFVLRRHHTGVLHWAARVLSLGYAVPGAVIAVGILLPVGLAQMHFPALPIAAVFTGTVVGLLYAYLVRFSAVALQSVEAGYARVPLAIDETARLLGSGRLRLFWVLHLPLLKRPAAAAALLVFVDVMKELPATLVLRPFGSDTLAVVAYNLARDERLGEAALPSLAIVAVGLIPVIMLSRTLRAYQQTTYKQNDPASVEP